MDEDKDQQQLTQQEVRHRRVMGVFPPDAYKEKFFFVFLFSSEEVEKAKKKRISLTFFHSQSASLFLYIFMSDSLPLFPQIRLRRLRKLGVSSSNEKSDESGNHKTSKADEASNNNNSAPSDTTTPTPATDDKDDNKNVILSGKPPASTSEATGSSRNCFSDVSPPAPQVLPSIHIDDKMENDMNQSNVISKMETDECEKPDDRMDVEDNESNEKHGESSILKFISRMLDVTWNEQCDGLHIVKDTMSAILEGSLSVDNFPELISEIVNEMVRQFLSEALTKEVEVSAASDQILSSRMRNDDIEMDYEETTFAESSRPKQTKTCTAKEAALYYLIASFNRALGEKQLPDVSLECRQQIIKYAISLLDHDWIFGTAIGTSETRSRSPLLQVMYDETIAYQDFVRYLMTEVYNNHPKRFTKIFNLVLEDIYLDMRCKQIKSVYTLPTHSIDRLIELISLSLINDENVKPICNLVVSHATFMPPMCTDIPGREISHVSYLSPFLSISILVYDRFYDEDNSIESVIQLDLQSKLDYVRTLLHKLFYTFILNRDTRDTVLKYIAELLKQNAKRTQYNADERSLAQDGFMLNLMAVMQQLSIKIKMDRIDPMYPFHPQSLVNIDDDTKLRFETADFVAHMEKLKNSQQWEEPKFISHCWFFTMQAHHLGIIPSISRYHKRLRAIKELQRMVDELNATKSRWENTPVARRNRQARDKWANRIKKLTKAKNTMEVIILDPVLNRNCLQFYSTVCDYILHQIEGRKTIEGTFYNKIPPGQLKATDEFSSMPVWYIEDIADYLLFLLT